MALTDKLTAIGNAIRAKTGGSSPIPLADMPSAIQSIETGLSQTDYEFNQINTDVRAYIQNVTYDPSDYTVSYIASYVNDTTHFRPLCANVTIPTAGTLVFQNGERSLSKVVSVGTEAVYNSVPNSKAPYTVMKSDGTIVKYGVIKPTGDLRMIYLNDTKNIRDLGGWACDGGSVKYNKIFRGGRPFISYEDGNSQTLDSYDLNVLRNLLGIRRELDLRYANEISRNYSLIGEDVEYIHIDGAWYAISNESQCKSILDVVMDSVIKGVPIFFHCAGGADRTGTLAMWIEAILGVDQSDIDKDYELTSFFSGVSSDDAARRRNENEWKNLINAFSTYPGNSLSQKVVAWVITLGIPISKINAFRTAMIDGTPSAVTNPYGTVSVLKALTHITIDNPDSTIEMYQPYTAILSADSGYSLSSATVSVTMGGVDITSTCYSNGVISIAKVTGAVSITATVASMYTNQITESKDTIGGTNLYNGTGYKNGARYNSSFIETTGTDCFTTGYIKLNHGDVVHLYGNIFSGVSGSFNTAFYTPDGTLIASLNPYNVNQKASDNTKLTNVRPLTYDSSSSVLSSFTWNDSEHTTVWVKFTFVGSFSAGTTVVTINEEM